MVFCAAVADASSKSTELNGEVVPGIKDMAAPDDVNNEDRSRESKVCLRHAHIADSMQSELNML